MKPWRVVRPVAADSSRVDEEQDLDPFTNGKLDPDPH